MNKIVTEKTCPRCTQVKTISEFSLRSGRQGVRAWCKVCESEKSRVAGATRRKEHPEVVKAYKVKEYKKDKEKINKRTLAYYYKNKKELIRKRISK